MGEQVERAQRSLARRPLAWLTVAAVGAVVLVVVLGLQLFPRLDDGQAVLDDLSPAMSQTQVATARGGVDMVATIVNTVDPLALESGGAADEVPALIAFVSDQTGLSQDQVLATLGEQFPHVLGLLQALPLESVTTELGELVPFLAEAMGISPDEVLAALHQNFPHLAQSIANLPTVTSGWADVPGTPGTRFDGSKVTTMTDVSGFFSADVIPVLERQDANFRDLDSLPGGVDFLPPLLAALGVIVVIFGLAMTHLARGTKLTPRLATAGWGVVVVVGAGVLLLVGGWRLYPRLSGAQDLLDDAKPAFTDERVATSRGGIDIISSAVDTLDPLVLESGGAADEVPALIAFVSDQTGLSQDQVFATLGEQFPHVLGLLQALPLESVTTELGELVPFLARTIGLSDDRVVAALQQNFPRVAQSIELLPTVTGGWADVPDTPGSRFDGTDINSVPDTRDYFNDDLIPVAERQRDAFQNLESTWPPTSFFPPLLTVVGLGVVAFGVLMLLAARKEASASATRDKPTGR